MRPSTLLLLSTSSVAFARVAPAPPVITPAPSLDHLDLSRRQNDLDLASLAQVLMTAVPPSILGLALTNVPAVSRLLWSEFLDDHTPAWFTALPTDIQQYLSGEFGPTTAASTQASTTPSITTPTAAASQTALNNQSGNQSSNGGGLPLWVKVVIGIVVPLFVLALIALAVFCCLRRRRRRRAGREPRAPTPAFTSSSLRPTHSNRQVEKEVALKGGYHSNTDYHTSSDSDTFQTPVGGPSYEEIPPATGIGMQQRNRGSRQSFSSLHSVPEVPEAMHDRHHMPLPPRSPRRSRDFSSSNPLINAQRRRSSLGAVADNGTSTSPLNPAYHGDQGRMPMQDSPYNMGQGIYAGGQNPYPANTVYKAYSPYEANPFTDPSPPRQNHMASGGYRGSAGTETHHDSAYARHSPDDYENEWPLRSPRSSGGFGYGEGQPRQQQHVVHEM